MSIERKTKEAKRAIDTLEGDTSVPMAETLEALEDVQEHLAGSISALKTSIKMEGG